MILKNIINKLYIIAGTAHVDPQAYITTAHNILQYLLDNKFISKNMILELVSDNIDSDIFRDVIEHGMEHHNSTTEIASQVLSTLWDIKYAALNKIPGGLSEDKSIDDVLSSAAEKLFNKYKNSTEFGLAYWKHIVMEQFNKGIKVESEHTSDQSIAKEIAADHLVEDPLYYSKLEKAEL